MESMPDGYSDAILADGRTVDIYVAIGTNIDNTAADDVSAVSCPSYLPMSNMAQITDAVYAMTPGLATYEGYGIRTADSAGMICPPLASKVYPPEAGLWSADISEADGSIFWPFTIVLSKEHTSAFQIYTDGPSVLEASVEFMRADGTTERRQCECFDSYFNVTESMTYTSITVTVTKLDAPYRHVRVVEVEFGASVTLSKKDLGGEVVVIEETDPLELSAPLHELDLSILNVDGTFDPDHPRSRLSELRIGYPLKLSYSVASRDGTKFTVPCGQYFIAERDSSDTRLDITAFDPRHLLTNVFAPWSLSASVSMGDTLNTLLEDYAIPHVIETDLYSVMPDADFTFGTDTSLADDLLSIQQAYGIYCVPDRTGSLRVTSQWPAGTYPALDSKDIYKWPSVSKSSSYNFVSIGWQTTVDGIDTTLYVETDLRTDATEGKNALQISNNPLIVSESRARTVMTRILSRLYSDTAEVDWRGDPAMDVGDTVEVPGRWTQESPRTYKIIRKEETYDGTFRAVLRVTD